MNRLNHINLTKEACQILEDSYLVPDSRIDFIITANLSSDNNQKSSAIHFDNCAFREGAERVSHCKSLYTMVSDRFSKRSLRALGRLLHTVQDFYAHSNWIEFHESKNPIPLWDLNPNNLTAEIYSGYWAVGKPKIYNSIPPGHNKLNKDSVSSRESKIKVSSGINQGKTYFELAYQTALNASKAELDKFIENVKSYRVTTFTGDRVNAGTDADVFIILYDSTGINTGRIYLDNKARNDFRRGHSDAFIVGTNLNIVDLTKISIGYATNDEDYIGDEPGWFLEKVSVDEIQSTKTWTFNCDRWLATDKGDGLTIIDLKPASVIPA